MATGSDSELIKISTVLWRVWFARNKRIFENKSMTPAATMSWSGKQILEWQTINKKSLVAGNGGNDKQVDDRKWKPPDAGYSKINIDASVYEGQHSFAVGMVLRDGQGKYIAGKVMRCEGQVSVLEAEVSGIVEALLWAVENTEGLVIVESDSLLGVRALNQGLENLLEIGDLINQGVNMLRSNDRLLVSFVRKQANKVVHSMARVPCQINTSIVLTSSPSYLLETILAESLMI
ncbi:uncharacterized protein LOC141697415 [Apium graveolens]|uniref:uncharacterized protein LOC141697415 n=1 Tax=Apium graveolens TaxID=4045 RepID=UPI003D78BC05